MKCTFFERDERETVGRVFEFILLTTLNPLRRKL